MRGLLARAKEALLEHAYLITLSAVVAVVAASAMYTQHVHEQNNAQVAAGAPEIEGTQSPAVMQLPETTPLPTIAPLTVHASALRTGGSRVWPVSGAVVRAYLPEEPVLWAALGCYQVHAGVDVLGKAEEDVLCIADGVVECVTRDDLWGWQVRVAQTDGTAALYRGLGLCALAEGQSVTRGQSLGTLMEAIPCEAELGAHLHLEAERDGERIDPQELLDSAK